MALLGATKPMVYPSGGELSAAAMPMFPPAPTLFSMMNCWPRRSDRYCPMMRATMSFGPPAVNDTIQWTGRICARATRDMAASAAAPAVICKNVRRGSFTAFPRGGTAGADYHAVDDTRNNSACVGWATALGG